MRCLLCCKLSGLVSLMWSIVNCRSIPYLEFLVSGVCFQQGSVFDPGSPWCGLCLPFYSSQGEGAGYIYGRKVKRGKGKRQKRKKKGGLGCGRLPPYPAWVVYAVAQRHNGCWAFGLSVRWWNALWPCFVLFASVPSRMGGACTWIWVERELGSIVAITHVVVEAWSSWRNDRSHLRT
jgi:hypothetical protein